MTVLTTRILSFLDPKEEPKEVVLTVFKPVRDESRWKVGFSLTPPAKWEKYYSYSDVNVALLRVLVIVSANFQGMGFYGRLHWQGRIDCGLPDIKRRPPSWAPPEISPPVENPGDLEVFSTSRLSYPDEAGVECELPLIIFMPTQAEEGRWKCGFTFGSKDSSPIHYGVGDDFIEAFLDAASIARLVHQMKVPVGWKSEERVGCEYLPYKVGRSYYLDESTE